MKRVESVWAAMAAKKQALSSKKLELSALDDIKESRQLLEKAVGDAEKIAFDIKAIEIQIDEVGSMAYGALSDVDSFIAFFREDYETAERALDEYQRLANDLGINANENQDWEDLRIYLTNDFADAQSKLQDYYALLDDLTSAIRNL